MNEEQFFRITLPYTWIPRVYRPRVLSLHDEVFCLLPKVWMANEKSRGVPASETHCGDKRAAEQRLGRGRQAC